MTQIIDKEPLPDINNVNSRVIREEQHYNVVRSKELKSDAIDFSAQTELPKTYLPQAATTTFRTRDPNRTCTHFYWKGHDNTKCFLLHGYPYWWLEQ